MCVLGWDSDTVAMAISVLVAKLERLRDMLIEWAADQEVASEDDLRSLIGRLLHVCEVVRPGKHFVRRMLNHLGLPPVRAWSAEFTHRARARHRPPDPTGS